MCAQSHLLGIPSWDDIANWDDLGQYRKFVKTSGARASARSDQDVSNTLDRSAGLDPLHHRDVFAKHGSEDGAAHGSNRARSDPDVSNTLDCHNEDRVAHGSNPVVPVSAVRGVASGGPPSFASVTQEEQLALRKDTTELSVS